MTQKVLQWQLKLFEDYTSEDKKRAIKKKTKLEKQKAKESLSGKQLLIIALIINTTWFELTQNA